jgi:heterodisulfide reductase subunit B
LREIPDWQCCGATFPLAIDDTLALVAPARVLCQARECSQQVVALCAICYHVLRRCQAQLARDEQMLSRINWFIEEDYQGDLRVLHMLEVLRDEVGWEKVSGLVKRPLTGLRVAPYYGCLLLRPEEEIGLDDPEAPTILHRLLSALGAEVVGFPLGIECCGSYLVAKEPGVPAMLAREILASARGEGANMIATACPLCQFNLDYAQRDDPSEGSDGAMPIVYFTQLMAIAFDLPEATWGLDGQYVSALPLVSRLEPAVAGGGSDP